MGRDRAAYMREYRKRRKPGTTLDEMVQARDLAITKDAIIRALEEEVRHLKAELAKRPPETPLDADPRINTAEFQERVDRLHAGDRFNSRPFTPVPKSRK